MLMGVLILALWGGHCRLGHQSAPDAKSPDPGYTGAYSGRLYSVYPVHIQSF